jgi:TonB family protein
MSFLDDPKTALPPKIDGLPSIGAALAAIALLVFPTMPARADDWVISSAEASISEKAVPLGAKTMTFSIKPQPLDSALDAFGVTTGIELLYGSPLTSGRRSSGVIGSFTPDEALQILLADTGLQFVQTAPHAIKLVADAQSAHATPALAVSASQLTLSPLHVQAPSLRDFLPYATVLRYAIQDAIRHDGNLRRGRYRAILNVWVSPAGTVQRSQYLRSTGNDDLDGAILKTVQKVELRQSPPSDLPQPVHVWILTGAGSASFSEVSPSTLDNVRQR